MQCVNAINYINGKGNFKFADLKMLLLILIRPNKNSHVTNQDIRSKLDKNGNKRTKLKIILTYPHEH